MDMHNHKEITLGGGAHQPSVWRRAGSRIDGWAGALGIGVFLAGWHLAALGLNPVVLPSPSETLAALARLVATGEVLAAAAVTTTHALSGFGVAALLGTTLGSLAGWSSFIRRLVWPPVMLLQGVPPIARIVLALIWFGTGRATAVLTVTAAILPLVFVSTLEGVQTVDRGLLEMARAFRAPSRVVVADIIVPHVISYVFPAVVVGIGTAWKVALMAELLSGAPGIGEALGVARINLNTAMALAWIGIAVGLMLAVQYLVVHPLKRRLEPWRQPQRETVEAERGAHGAVLGQRAG